MEDVIEWSVDEQEIHIELANKPLLLLISIKLSTVNLSQNTDSMQNIKYFII